MAYFVGIDGGGTRATAVVLDDNERELARVVGDAGLVLATDPAARAPGLAELTRLAASHAGLSLPAECLCCALAGAGREPERSVLEQALAGLGVARRVRVVTDAEAALQDALGAGPGMLLIAGTGSIAWGRTSDGRTARSGGWGQLLGDEGSGYALGLGALRAIARAHDGRGAPTVLRDTVLRHLDLITPEELIAWAGRAAKADVASLAPLVLAAASEDDVISVGLVEIAARELALHVASLYERLAPWDEPVTLALAGGLLSSDATLRQPAIAAIRALRLAVAVLDRDVDAARGAATIASGP